MKKQGEMRTAVSSATMFLMGLAVFAIQLKGLSDEQIHSPQKRAVFCLGETKSAPGTGVGRTAEAPPAADEARR